jgi:hypothetical protein
MLNWLTQIFVTLPLPWLIAALSNVGWGWVVYKLWSRNNDVMDQRVKDSQEYSDKYHDIVDKVNQTLQTILLLKGNDK